MAYICYDREEDEIWGGEEGGGGVGRAGRGCRGGLKTVIPKET